MSSEYDKIYNPEKDDEQLKNTFKQTKEVCKMAPKGQYQKFCDFSVAVIETGIQKPKETLQSKQKEQNAWLNQFNNGGLMVKQSDEAPTQPTVKTTQTPTKPSRLELSKDERNELLNYFQAYNLPFDAK